MPKGKTYMNAREGVHMKTTIVVLVFAAALLLSAAASVQGAYSYDGSTYTELAKPANVTGRQSLPQQNVTPAIQENVTEENATSVYTGETYTIERSRDMGIGISNAVPGTIQDTGTDVAEGTSYGPSSPAQEPPEERAPEESIEVPGQASETAPEDEENEAQLPTEKSTKPAKLTADEKREEKQETKPNVFVRLAKFFRGIFG